MKKTSQKKFNRGFTRTNFAKIRNLNGFTLIELLIVIGILAVLAVIALLSLNPGEIQKKSRDVQRTKDMATLQAVVQQLLDRGTIVCTATTGCESNKTDLTCKKSWLLDDTAASINVCEFTPKTVVDPLSGRTATVLSGSTAGSMATKTPTYKIKFSGSDYIICARQESESNRSKMATDGIIDQWYSAVSGTQGILDCE